METEKRLMSLIHSVRVLNSTRDLSDVLHQLIKEVLKVISGSNASVLFLYDKRTDELYAKSAIGFDMKYLKDVRMKPGQGMSGKTFSSRRGRVFTSSKDTYSGMSNLTSEAKEIYAKSLGSMEYPMSAICVPLMSNGESIGVLTVDIYEENIQFDEKDLELLETFATQATIAIENATLFSQNERTKRIHEELSRVSLSKGGLEDITKSLAALIEKPIIVFNEFMEPLALSDEGAKDFSAELGQKYIDMLYQVINEENVSYHNLELINQEHFVYFFPIKTEKFTMGLLTIVVEDQLELDPLDRFAIEQALTIFAMEIDRQERLLADDFSYSGTILEQLIQAPYDDLSSDHLAKINFPEHDYHHYVIVQLYIQNPLLSFQKINEKKAQLMRVLYRELSKLPYKTLVYDKNMELTFMFTVRASQSEERVFAHLKQLYKKIIELSKSNFQLSNLVGLGQVVNRLKDVHISYRDAKRSVQYLQSTYNEESLITYRQLGPNRLFLKMDRKELQEYVDETIGEIISYDKQHDTELKRTLEVYLELNQNMSESSKNLFVHVNTIKYRLRAINDLLNIDRLSGEKAFELQLALHILNYLTMKKY
ncbi:helix-turn-helix domain-containing protein [Halobacillus seohaensis]|uniref:Helix-turn-helix domain-containing protein n=1 Tax=Halobacillus seohaensis TaxID=447421 RepID=A0ABW2ENV4_9BACI